MSLRLRVRYQMRSVMGFIYSFHVPAFLTGKAAKAVLSTAFVFLAIGYFIQISHLTTGGYEIARLEKKIALLNDESQRLSTDAASYQSLSSVQERLKTINMVPATEITYIKAPAEQVVAQR